jgi:hypothetical protein
VAAAKYVFDYGFASSFAISARTGEHPLRVEISAVEERLHFFSVQSNDGGSWVYRCMSPIARL